MAVARGQAQGGISAIHIWLIVFVALWLASTVLLVIIYLDHEEKDKRVADLQAEAQKLVSATGRKLPQYAQARPPKSTVVDLLEEARAETARIAGGGDGVEDPSTLRDKLANEIEQIRSNPYARDGSFAADSYHEALENLFGLFRDAAQGRQAAEDRSEELRVELDELRRAQEAQKAEFDDQASQLKARLAEIEAEAASSTERHARQIDDFEEQIRRINEQCSDNIQAQRSENSRLQTDYEELLARYQDLKDKLGQAQISPMPGVTSRQGDGVIMKATPGDDVVYIDLGRRDHLTLGLEFAVYDSLTGIPESGLSKARIEVVRLHDNSAECRVAQLLGNSMVAAGDIIANPIYDRHRSLRFYVLGEFDFDGDQRPDPDGAERVVSLIEAWGGLAEDQLSAQVDFVVLGGPPALVPRSPELDIDEDSRYEASRRARDAYMEQKATVEAMSIPTLTQGVFLNFLGYAGTTAALPG